MDQLQCILSQVDCRCVRSVCEDDDGKCSLSLEETSDYLLLSMDGEGSPVPHGETKCDFLFFGSIQGYDYFWACPVELTVGLRKPWTRIIRQLRAGARLLNDLVPVDWEVQFVPIIAGPIRRAHLDQYRQRDNFVCFQDSAVPVRSVECSSRISDVLTRQLEK